MSNAYPPPGSGQPAGPPASWSPIPQQGPASPQPRQDWRSPAAPQWAPPPGWPSQAWPGPGGPRPAHHGLAVGALPDGVRTYPQMLRGPRYHWWRAFVALVIVGGLAIAAQFLAIFPFVGFGVVVTRGQGLGQWLIDEFDKLAAGQVDAAGFFLVNLGLMALIPAVGISIWAAHHIRPRFVSSVAGGFRWRWLARCLFVVIPVWGIYVVVSLLGQQPSSDRPAEWLTLLVLVLLTTPLQAAGEEYFFRGWILQNVGSWFKRPMLSLVSGTVVSAVAFSAAHGSPDPWILANLAIFAIACCLLTWRTGGLEGAVAMHAVNNIAAFVTVINLGGWDKAFIGSESKGDPVQFAIDATVQVSVFALLWWQAKRAKVVSTYRPAHPSPDGRMFAGQPLPRHISAHREGRSLG